MKNNRVYILGGYQTDFSRNWSKEGKGIQALIFETMQGAFTEARIDPSDIQVLHVGNFAAELYTMQAHLGALAMSYYPALWGIPTSRHEAACASGSIAALAARTEIEAGIYDCTMVLGVEYMRSVDSETGGNYLGTAAWYEKECEGIEFPFPKLFDRLYDVYEERYGLDYEYLAQIATINYDNAKRNPKSQTRDWYMSKQHACSSGAYNRTIGTRLRASDCSQVTDGAAAVFFASERYAQSYAKKHGVDLAGVPYIMGWGHATAPLLFDDKVAEARTGPYVLPHTRKAILDGFQRARKGIEDVSCIETHDCFSITEYAAIEHFGLAEPGEGWRAVDEGIIEMNGSCPINPSGGLIGCGHPVGATGVRQLLDAYLQVVGKAGDYQVEGARCVATLNIGGSATTNVVHIVGRDH
jgi:acetyl-CoA C-acetyltransferase